MLLIGSLETVPESLRVSVQSEIGILIFFILSLIFPPGSTSVASWPRESLFSNNAAHQSIGVVACEAENIYGGRVIGDTDSSFRPVFHPVIGDHSGDGATQHLSIICSLLSHF